MIPVTDKLNISWASDYTSDLSEEDWPLGSSFVVASDNSDPLSHNVSEGYQWKQIGRAKRATEDGSSDESDIQTHTKKRLQAFPRVPTPPEARDDRPWPNTDRT